jgi:hypothetical protein
MPYEPDLTEPQWCDKCFFNKSLWACRNLCDTHYFIWVRQYYGRSVLTDVGVYYV